MTASGYCSIKMWVQTAALKWQHQYATKQACVETGKNCRVFRNKYSIGGQPPFQSPKDFKLFCRHSTQYPVLMGSLYHSDHICTALFGFGLHLREYIHLKASTRNEYGFRDPLCNHVMSSPQCVSVEFPEANIQVAVGFSMRPNEFPTPSAEGIHTPT